MNAVQLNTDQRCLTTLGTVDGVPSLLTCTTIPAISFASFGIGVYIVWLFRAIFSVIFIFILCF